MNREQFEKIRLGDGFIAALDQSGGSTPKALKLYGVGEGAYTNGQEMFRPHPQDAPRIITSPTFDGDRIMGAILFENTMDREIEGRGAAEYLWSVKRVVPFLKVDKGPAAEADGVQLMKPIPDLDQLLARAREKGVFGTKMRSVVKRADPAGVRAIARQQFEIAQEILATDLVPILESAGGGQSTHQVPHRANAQSCHPQTGNGARLLTGPPHKRSKPAARGEVGAIACPQRSRSIVTVASA